MDPISPDNAHKPQDVPYEPRMDYLILEPITISESRIVMPDKVELPVLTGVVVKVGPGRTLEFNGAVEPVDVKPGDLVLMGALNPMFAPIAVAWKGHELIFVRSRDVAGIRTDAPWGVQQKPAEESAAA